MRTDDVQIPDNWDEAEVVVSDAYFPHSLRPSDAVTAPQVTLRKVDLGRDHGSKVEIRTGLTRREELVANPTDDLRDGMKVMTTAPPLVQ